MSGAGSDLPDGFVPDGAPPSPGEDVSGLTVEGILREAGYVPQPDWQQVIGGKLLAVVGRPPEGAEGVRTYSVADSPDTVADVVMDTTGRIVGTRPVWVRFARPAEGKGALLVISAPHPLDGADLIVVAHRGMITRGLLRDAATLAFLVVGLSRLTARIPALNLEVQDYARRAGFVCEGTSRDLYGPGLDGQRWVMTPASCPWLPRRVRPVPHNADTSPPFSLKVH